MSAVAEAEELAARVQSRGRASAGSSRAASCSTCSSSVVSLLWLFPLLWAVYTSLRPYGETAEHGYVSIASTLTLDNYVNAWDGGRIPMRFLNTLIVARPGRDRRPDPGFGDRVRGVALQLPVQPASC